MRPESIVGFCAWAIFANCSGPESSPTSELERVEEATEPAAASEPLVASAPLATSEPVAASTSGPRNDFEELVFDLRSPFVGDFDELRSRRVIRVLVSYSKSNFFYDKGHPRGFEVELLSRFEKFLNEKADLESRVRLAYIATPFDRLLADLQEGKGDIAAAGLTVTPTRLEAVAFSSPYLTDVREVIVTHGSVEALDSLEDLAGREVFVTAGSSYAEHLIELSRRLEAKGRPAIEVVQAAPELATEDILEMVHAGILEISAADAHVAEAWGETLGQLRVRQDLILSESGTIGWAVRRQNPGLRAKLDTFIDHHRKGTLVGNILFRRYFTESRWIENPLSESERAKVERGAELWQDVAELYDLDWLALVAQAYQESRLDQGKTSPAGAVGVLQLLPSTAADPVVGIPDISTLENNVQAGAKYLAFLRDRYFSDPDIGARDRLNFAWAAYNAGPARVRRMRASAAESGLDPNRWFRHVEQIAAQEIGRETVDYVANINKYYVAYRLSFEADQRRRTRKRSKVDG